MKQYLFGTLIFFISVVSYAQNMQPMFDSAHSIALDGFVENGKILVNSPSPFTAEKRIQEQMKYTIGQLNGVSSVADLNRLEINILDIIPTQNNKYSVSYEAHLFIAWPRNLNIPEEFQLILPESTENQALYDFYEQYVDEKCQSSGAHDLSVGIFWYYYRPNNQDCQLGTEDQPAFAVKFSMQLSVSEENTQGKYPEYHKVWEDGRLVITAIFGMADSENTSTYDAGVYAFQQMYHDVIRYYGELISTSLPPGTHVGLATPEIRLVLKSESGPVEVNLFLVEGIRFPYNGFRQKYNKLTKYSDFISYAGHSGLGANIRALARMGKFVKDQYQIFLINGCDTFAYTDHALRDAHVEVNPLADSPYRYIDLITNAMPAFFHSNVRAVMAVVRGLTEKRKTYREILSDFDSYQKASVVGEHDNRWPEPF
ncbi:MAG: hypothetical protein HOO06_09995 [Bdellovibrionaceae bacterium]|nr:hypothetical protein [Pseudobdellovibrionaceae bacterium]